MIIKTISLSPKHPDATLTVYIHDEGHSVKILPSPRPAMIVCPGGGYHALSEREAEPIALRYIHAGMNAFVLRYTVKDGAKNYAPLIQAALAIRHIREHAEEYNIDPDRVFIVGFSAGGHLAASSGILWNCPAVRDALGVSDGSCPEGINRPNGMILSYPVISGLNFSHRKSFCYLCGKEDPSEEERKAFSLEYHVDETTPPVFIWHTFNDTLVPVQNSLLLMNALCEHKIPFEGHIFPDGPHGMALSTEETRSGNDEWVDAHVAHWTELSVEWIMSLPRK